VPKGVVIVLNVFAESKELANVAEQLAKLPEIVDLYEVTGEYDLVAILTVGSISEFRDILKNKILQIKGLRSTVSSVIIHFHKKDGKIISE
jgi:DNA-binding Lrp family transcriptional regulator